MEELRKEEIEFNCTLIKWLCTIFPDKLNYKEYVHPVLGNRESVELVPYSRTLDMNTIHEVHINVLNNTCTIKSALGTFILNGLYKEENLFKLEDE